MTIQTNGAELKRFFSDEAAWPTDGRAKTFYDDAVITVDGVVTSDTDNIADASVVTVAGGVVYNPRWEESDAPSLEDHFLRWRQSQRTVRVVIEVAPELLGALTKSASRMGGKVLA